jgi:hypothetical protein
MHIQLAIAWRLKPSKIIEAGWIIQTLLSKWTPPLMRKGIVAMTANTIDVGRLLRIFE